MSKKRKTKADQEPEENLPPKRRGPPLQGLGSPFTLRVYEDQEERIQELMLSTGQSKGAIIRQSLQLG